MGRTWLWVVLAILCGCNLIAPLGTAPPSDGGGGDATLDGDAGPGPVDATADGDTGPDQLYDASPDLDAPPPCVTSDDCDDGLTCTKDVCLAGACSNPVIAGWCLIGQSCVPDGQLHPTNECRLCDTATSTGAWTDVPDAKPCDDGLSCTKNDACFHGACMGDVDPGYCVIGPPGSQVCHLEGAVDPANTCAVCEPSFYTHAWSPKPGCVLTLAGAGSNTVKDGYLLSAQSSEPTALVAAGGKIYVADTDGHAIRVVERSLVTTLAGCG